MDISMRKGNLDLIGPNHHPIIQSEAMLEKSWICISYDDLGVSAKFDY